ncbi:uncharacterized protein (DUF362 family) [Orenia metallireducens]|uniref:Uncharacterized conserved protein, DUF362 family n=1 Tax=Orenia metallireducens TaxID=1413210 RepID=A0A285GZU3_9FIRM|nr:DUF362 domain-containing protein [Orenia metallireducens]PRX21801.1 uncharacterized protein (DUF362 family) [Orenia metallireducens]SNY29099.1 Uncharacterized conserved protein, DUF362 family [Orenia metallireducens]
MKVNNIYVSYGDSPKEMIIELLTEIKPEREIRPESLIGIKPNLVVAKKSSSGATTDPNLVAGVIEYLQSKGYHNLIILEGSWVGDRTARAFKACGYEELSKRYNVPLIDLQKDKYQTHHVMGLDINLCQQAVEVDYLINMPVLKGHCQTRMTCALKNLKGCITDNEKRKFHTLGLHKPIAYLNKALRQDLVIVDGIIGDLDFEEGGNPVQMNRVIVGKDPVLIDTYAAELMGHNLDDVPYIKMAEAIGVGSTAIEKAVIIELNKDQGVQLIKPSRKIKGLAKYIEEADACSACYGSLIHALKRLDEQGRLRGLKEKIYIGQGYQNQELIGLGVGVCTRGATKNIKGCPPKAKDIIEFIEKNL